MRTDRLIYVKAWSVLEAPPVCTASWTAEDWRRVTRRACEPLVIDFAGEPWTATGDRNDRGELLYERGR